MSTSEAKAEAFDASVQTEDNVPAARPATDAERAYLDARVADLEAGIEKVTESIKGQQATLKTLKAELVDARKAQKGGAE